MTKKFLDKAIEIGELVEEKNAAYGSSFHKSDKILNILFEDGIRPDQMRDALAITRIVDKLFRIATKKDAFGENPWRDIAGYGIIMSTDMDIDGSEESIDLLELLKSCKDADLTSDSNIISDFFNKLGIKPEQQEKFIFSEK